MPDTLTAWTLEGFGEALDQWIELEDPPDDLRMLVTHWVLSRFDDPYQGVRREPGFDNLWFGVIPGSLHGDDMVVGCSYWILETERAVRCDIFGNLGWPV